MPRGRDMNGGVVPVEYGGVESRRQISLDERADGLRRLTSNSRHEVDLGLDRCWHPPYLVHLHSDRQVRQIRLCGHLELRLELLTTCPVATPGLF
jgi:hypothetical protein